MISNITQSIEVVTNETSPGEHIVALLSRRAVSSSNDFAIAYGTMYFDVTLFVGGGFLYKRNFNQATQYDF